MKKGLVGLLFLSLAVAVLPSCGNKNKQAKTTKTKKMRKHGEKKASKKTTKKSYRKKGEKKATMKNNMKKNNGRRYGLEDSKSPKEELVA